MITAVDTNVLVALLGGTEEVAGKARRSLEKAGSVGTLTVSPVVYAELISAPGRGAEEVEHFLKSTRIEVDWVLDREVWSAAALAYKGYAQRRREQPDNVGPRRILADFVIGAHALHSASALLTFDQRIYRAAFPRLEISTPE